MKAKEPFREEAKEPFREKANPVEKTELSMFNTFFDTTPLPCTLEQVVELIRNNEALRMRTQNYRMLLAQGSLHRAAAEKQNCPCFSVAVRFRKGKTKDCINGWTMLTMVDLDKVPPERMAEVGERIRQDPHTLLHYTTISGRGHRIVAAIDRRSMTEEKLTGKAYAAAFEQCNRYYAKLTDCAYDEKCKNSTRISGLAHDSEVFFNPQALPFDVKEAVRKATSVRDKRQMERLRKVADLARAELKKQGVAYEPHAHNDYVMRMGYLMNAFGVNAEMAADWAVREFPDYPQAESVFRSCYQREEEFGSRKLPSACPADEDGRKLKLASVEEIEEFLHAEANFRKNLLTSRVEVCMKVPEAEDGADSEAVPDAKPEEPAWKPLGDAEVHSLWRRMCKKPCRCRVQDMLQVINSDFTPDFHPFLDYFRQLPPWDGKRDYLQELMDQVHFLSRDEELFFRKYFPKWFVGMVASLNDADTVNQLVLVLIGEQGIYKTSWLSRLLPPELKQYFNLSLSKNKMSKDDYLRLCENALVCLEELEDLSKINTQLKALVTMPAVSERAAYARFKEDHPHWSSFCGTGNLRHFLVDLTGNRRFLPVEISGIEDPYAHPLDYEGLYAQALAMYHAGFRFFLSSEEIREVNGHNEDYQVPCLERDLIQTLYQVPMKGAADAVFLTVGQILQTINMFLHVPLNTMRLGLAMKQLGFRRVKAGGKRGYLVIELNAESVNRNKHAMARYVQPPEQAGEETDSMETEI